MTADGVCKRSEHGRVAQLPTHEDRFNDDWNSRAFVMRSIELVSRGLRIAALACLGVFIGCGGQQQQAPPPPPTVAVVTLEAQAVSLTTELPGRTTAFRIAEVRPRVGGVILKRLFTEGTNVQAGQQLYQIDPRRFEADFGSRECEPQAVAGRVGTCPIRGSTTHGPQGQGAVAEKEYQDANFAEQAASAAVDLALSEQRTAALIWNGP